MWKLSLVLGLGASLLAFAAGWKVHDWRDAASQLQAAKSAVTSVRRQDAVSQTVAVADQRTQDRVRTVTRTLVQKVPVYVTQSADARFPLPWGFVRLHDAAALGRDLSAAPPGAGQPDDAASSVRASAAAAVVIENYGACHADQQRLTALQAWVRGEGLAP